MNKKQNPVAGCTAGGAKDQFAKQVDSRSGPQKSKQFYYLHVADNGTEHRLEHELPHASLRVERYGDCEITITANVHVIKANGHGDLVPVWAQIQLEHDR